MPQPLDVEVEGETRLDETPVEQYALDCVCRSADDLRPGDPLEIGDLGFGCLIGNPNARLDVHIRNAAGRRRDSCVPRRCADEPCRTSRASSINRCDFGFRGIWRSRAGRPNFSLAQRPSMDRSFSGTSVGL